MPVLIYTQNKQIISTVSVDHYWKDEAYHAYFQADYVDYPDKFFGIGNHTREEDEETFTSRMPSLLGRIQRRIAKGFYVGLEYQFAHYKLRKLHEDGVLIHGLIPGSLGGTVSGAGGLVNWDTRDNVFFPMKGHFHALTALFFGSSLGSDFNYNVFTLDLRKYMTISQSHVLALQGYANIISGNPPFQKMSLLGGPNMMRGYFQGRYRDRNMVVFQAEYRAFVWGPLGMAAFVGFGDVASDVEDFMLRDLKTSYGFGLRYMFDTEERINLRLDFGFGQGKSGTYVAAVEAF